MRSAAAGLTVFLLLTAPFFPSRARACDPWFPSSHTIDPAQAAVDTTPPQLGQPTVTEVHTNESGDGCVNQKCGWDHSARLTNLATDDVTPADQIGYRVTLMSGDVSGVTTGLSVPALADAGSLVLFWDGGDDFDFTTRLTAIDAAGNESAPATVHISSGGGGCSVGHQRARAGFGVAVLALALAGAASRQRRRRRARSRRRRTRRWPPEPPARPAPAKRR